MKILFAVVNLVFLSFVAYRLWRVYRQSSIVQLFWPSLVLKAAAGIGLGLIYLYYYRITADTFLFFEDAKKLTELARTDFFSYLQFLFVDDETHPLWEQIVYFQSRALFMVKLTSLVGLITFDNYWIISLYFSMMSFFAAWKLTNVIVESFPSAKVAAIIAFLFFPSVVFWSSGVIKESVSMATLFFLCAVVVEKWEGKKLPWWEWVVFILSAWLLWRLKYYYLAVFLPISAAAIVTHRLSQTWLVKSIVINVLIWSATFIVPLAVISSLRPNFYPGRILDVIVYNNHEFNSISDPHDVIEYASLEPTVGSVAKNVPWALVSGIFRPFPWEAHTVFQWLIAIENLVLLLLFVASLSNIVSLVKSRQRLLLCSILLYVATLCVFLALSTPNFGTLSRYRISFLPFFFLLITIENPLVKKVSAFIQRS
ncbi:MAG TPA: hypothetical protein VK589_09790 [Chryseolinea sp.]|nr:hypothetical protein [Chryseolinea sp.]